MTQPLITPRALLRGRHLDQALRRVEPTDWSMDVTVEQGRRVTWSQDQLSVEHPDHIRDALRPSIEAASLYRPGDIAIWDDVLGVDKDGREVFVHRWRPRLVQRLWVEVAGGRIERHLPPNVFAYRPRTGTGAAHYCARALVGGGHHFAVTADISRFFPSTFVEVLEEVLGHGLYGLSNEMIALGLSFSSANVLREIRHPGVIAGTASTWEPSADVLLQGSVTAPLFANAAAWHLIDRPFETHFGTSCVYLRYADDILILTTTAPAASDALRGLHEIMETTPWILHPEKTAKKPIDLRDESLRWLGLELSAQGISLPEDKRDRFLDWLSSPLKKDRVQYAQSIADQLMLVSWPDVNEIVDFIDIHAPAGAEPLADAVLRTRNRRRRTLRRWNQRLDSLRRQHQLH